jgi:hypothetical protein
MNSSLDMLKEGDHYREDMMPAAGEKKLWKNPDPEESDTERSKSELARSYLTAATKRDIMLDYANPREELPKFAKGVDQVPPFDKNGPSVARGYDSEARQQVNLIIKSRTNFAFEEGKYNVTGANAAKYKAEGDSALQGPYDPGLSRSMRSELRRQSFMESSSAL